MTLTAAEAEKFVESLPKQDFQPVMLATARNTYGLARGFYEEYGVISIALGNAELPPVHDSKIVHVLCAEDYTTDEGFLGLLSILGETFARLRPETALVLVPCADTSATLLARHKETLKTWYLTSSIDEEKINSLIDKKTFSDLCLRHNLSHPSTVFYSYEDFTANKPLSLSFDFPIVVKSTDSVAYLSCIAAGMKKAYILHTHQELDDTVKKIFSSDYRASLVIQEFIPGDDTHMRVLNAYVNSDGSIAMMSLGQPLMEVWHPASLGNYAAIISGGDQEVYDKVAHFLQAVGYTGYVNFDMKYDERSKEFKFFELNPRAGGSSDFTTAGGLNMARWIVEDLVKNNRHDTVYGFERRLWLGVPKAVLRKYAPAGAAKDEALKLLKEKKYRETLFFSKDLSFSRLKAISKMWLGYFRMYHTWGPGGVPRKDMKDEL
ncbi:MAG: hypothetical protein IKS49_06800 [Actinomycetaceae bacterium]|nr:hypothetical protein [Actinomycetaceae bacterium]